MSTLTILILALLLDAFFGEPDWLWKRLTHPAVLMGKMVSWLDTRFNTGQDLFVKGSVGVVGLCLFMGILGVAISSGPFSEFAGGSVQGITQVVIVAILLAHKSLCQHVQSVADNLRISLDHARRSVAMIVGRDTAEMDAPAVARSAIESGAENFSDGVVAPAFWFLLGGLPGILIYKLVNTADSMIGYRTERHEQFGKFAARLDDVMNWVPARICAVLFVISRGTWRAYRKIFADAPLHRSPNAGWPEAAMAVSLEVALSGPRSYEGAPRDFPWVNEAGQKAIGPREIDQSVDVLWAAWLIMLVGLCLLGCVT